MIETNTEIIYYGFNQDPDVFEGIDILYGMSMTDLFYLYPQKMELQFYRQSSHGCRHNHHQPKQFKSLL